MPLSWMTSRATLHLSFRLSGYLLSTCPMKPKGKRLHLVHCEIGIGLKGMAETCTLYLYTACDPNKYIHLVRINIGVYWTMDY